MTNDRLDTLVVSLHVIAGIAILASSVAMAFAPAFPGWWCPLALVGAEAGIVAFAVFWDGQTQFLFKEGITGAIVSSALLVSALLFPRAFGD